MTHAYWVQFSQSELLSLTGLEAERYWEIEESIYDMEQALDSKCQCGSCMECLGMSWGDFI